MNKIVPITIVSIIIVAIIILPSLSDQLVDAKSKRKIDFTKTITSSQDPGQGHENHQLALILSPNTGTLYDGSLTYTASEPVQIVVLHEITKEESKGQPIWTVDGNTYYGLSLIDTGKSSGSFEFTGSALGLHTASTKPFTATVSVDGWIRGEPTEIAIQKIELKKESPTLLLSKANVPAKIPLHQGTFNGKSVYYIITDSSDKKFADELTKKQKWKVETAASIGNLTESIGKIYIFKNGINGKGVNNYQDDVLTSTPTQKEQYSPLRKVTNVQWKLGQNPELLDSEEKILKAKDGGRIELEETSFVINAPQIKWPESQLKIRQDKQISDNMTFGDGQVIDIDTKSMNVTFVAHRAWGHDGKTIYYIITDSTPPGPADFMGVTDSPLLSNLIKSPSVSDLYQFNNGIIGTGALGFQPAIVSASPGDNNYSPMFRIYTVEWFDPNHASILENKADIDSFEKDGKINVGLAKPMNSDHIINSPIIDPFQ